MDQDVLTKQTLKKHFSNCRMTERSLIIVEGKDDISFYDKISQLAKKKTKIIAIENVNGYSEGCDELIRATKDFQEKLNEEEKNLRFFLSIIDADVRKFRDETIEIPGMLTLKYYSYESHFITHSNINNLLTQITSISHDLLDHRIKSFCYEEIIKSSLDTLFLVSLEALKNSIYEDYNGLVGYKTLPNTDKKVTIELLLKNNILFEQINSKKEDLLNFANEHNLSCNYETLKHICKGKWLHGFYSYKLNKKIHELPKKCKENTINQCQYCATNNFEKCLYKAKINPQVGTLKELSLNLLDLEEVEYIIDRFSQLN